MKKVKSYNLSEEVIKAIQHNAVEDRRTASDWLDFYLYKQLVVVAPSGPMGGLKGSIRGKGGTGSALKLTKKVKSGNSEFDLVWSMYGKKGNRKTSLAKFNKMKDSNKKLMAHHLPKYIDSTPDKQFRKNLETYINQECWNDEVIDKLSKLEAVGDDRSYMLEEFK